MKSLKLGAFAKMTTLKEANIDATVPDVSKPIERRKVVYEKGNPLAAVEQRDF